MDSAFARLMPASHSAGARFESGALVEGVSEV